MKQIIVYPSSTACWHSLVKEASGFCKQELSEDLESYLVFLLMRYSQSTNLARKVIATEFLETAHRIGEDKKSSLQDIGDSCLLFSGLFPGRAKKRRVRVSYFVKIGKTAYSSLSLLSPLFFDLSNNFVSLMDVLQSMREIDSNIESLDPITAEEMWNDTGSQYALQTLKKFTSHSTVLHANISPLKH
jgi:hypothetical protein